MKAQLIDLPKIPDLRGNLSVVEQYRNIPFKIERTYLMYDVPGGEIRGGHAYKQSQEFIIALSGSFDVVVDDGQDKQHFQLNRSYYGLYVPNGTWRQLENFSTNSVALVLSSTHYSDEEYLYDYERFVKWRKTNQPKTNQPKTNQPETFKQVAAVEQSPIFEQTTTFKQVAAVEQIRLLDLPRIEFREGNITPMESNQLVSFDIKRVFYIYDIPGGESRGAHAHKTCHQFIIAAGGSFEVVLDDGQHQKTVQLNRPYQGLHVPPGIWCHEASFCSGSVCLVLTSELFDESDYIRDYKDYLNALRKL